MSSKFAKEIGTKDEVYSNIAFRTSGGLRKKDLIISKTGKIVSKKQSEAAKRRMKDGSTGLCAYCIKGYLKGDIKYDKGKVLEKESKKLPKKVKESKKLPKKNIPGAKTEKRVKELEKEISNLKNKAGKIAESSGKITKEVRDLLNKAKEKSKLVVLIKKYLRKKDKGK